MFLIIICLVLASFPAAIIIWISVKLISLSAFGYAVDLLLLLYFLPSFFYFFISHSFPISSSSTLIPFYGQFSLCMLLLSFFASPSPSPSLLSIIFLLLLHSCPSPSCPVSGLSYFSSLLFLFIISSLSSCFASIFKFNFIAIYCLSLPSPSFVCSSYLSSIRVSSSAFSPFLSLLALFNISFCFLLRMGTHNSSHSSTVSSASSFSTPLSSIHISS